MSHLIKEKKMINNTTTKLSFTAYPKDFVINIGDTLKFKNHKRTAKIIAIDESRYDPICIEWSVLDYEDHGTPADMGHVSSFREWTNGFMINKYYQLLEVAQ